MHVRGLRLIFQSAALSLISFTLTAQRLNADLSSKGMEKAVEKGLAYLRSTQKKDGSWSEYPAITAVSLSAFLQNGRTVENEPAVARGVKFLLRFAKPTGAICMDGKPAVTLPNYN